MNILLLTSWDSIWRFLVALLIFVFVLVITYFTTRFVGKYEKTRYTNHNLSIVESIRVGTNKMIAIVQVGSRYMVVSIGKDEVHFLMEISEEDMTWKHENGSSDNADSFQAVLNKFKDKLPGSKE